MYPTEKINIRKKITEIGTISFDGTGIIFKGQVQAKDENYVAKAAMYIDGKLVETANLPASYRTRRNELFWKYQLPEGKHNVTFKWLNPESNASISFGEALVYSDAPRVNNHQSSTK